MKLERLRLVYHTLRHLRPIQISNRFHRRFRPARFVQIEAQPVRQRGGCWQSPAERPALLTGPSQQRVFQRELSLASPMAWNHPDLSHLELYNLHYFDDLVAHDAASRSVWHQDLIERWIAENPPGKSVGWEPYPLSLRIVNWIKWAQAGNSLSDAARQSLATQTQALLEQLEYHLLANHLFANAKALVTAGAFFDGPLAQQWLHTGCDVLQQELREQILGDGGHFELSPMYHSIILEDLLDLMNLHRAYPTLKELQWICEWFPDLLAKMRYWLRVMTHPDGQIAFFNDAAVGIASSPDELDRYARRLDLGVCPEPSVGLTHLEASGYVRLQVNDAVLLLDVAPVGPAYQPGHAHADTLSCEMSLGPHRVLVNSGTSCYGVSDERLRQRGTSAHSTVEVEGKDSSEVWSGFRVGRRAHPFDLKLSEEAGVFRVACSHDGYHRLRGRVTHRRFCELREGQLRIQDQLTGRWQQATARFLCHPDVEVRHGASPRDYELLCAGRHLHASFSAENVQRIPTSYHPQFGVDEPAQGIAVHFPPQNDKRQMEHLLELTWV